MPPSWEFHLSFSLRTKELTQPNPMQGGDLRTALWTDDIEGTFEWGWHQRGRAAAVDIAEGLNFLHSNGIVHR